MGKAVRRGDSEVRVHANTVGSATPDRHGEAPSLTGLGKRPAFSRMCVLTRDEIMKELDSGRLKIEPFFEDQVGPASIDLHLGHSIRQLPRSSNGPLHVTDDADPSANTQLIEVEDYFVLDPGSSVHGATLERVSLPPNLCAWIEGRSRIARFGLTVHVSSGFVQPGVSNHQVLELANLSSVALALHPGIRICQIVLERTEGQAVYRGRFAHQAAP